MPAKISESRMREIASLYENYSSIKKLCQATGHGQRTVQKAIRLYGQPRASKVGKNSTNLFKELDEISSYWLGFIAADGHIRFVPEKYRYELVVEVNKKDEEHLNLLSEYVGFCSKTYRTRDDCVIFSFSSKQLVNNLILWINPNNKTELNNFDKIPSKFKKDFVRGYFDGDGHRSGWRFGITSCPETLIPICNYISSSINEEYKTYSKGKGSKALDAKFSARAGRKFFEKFNGEVRLERKW